jgi:hypothetical protein
VASRFSINLDTLFQGISEFIPPSNFQAKMAVMSAPMMLAGIGLDWTMLSGALDGHVLLGISLNGVSKVLQQQAGLEQAVLVLGVKDEAKADRLLSTLVEMIKKQGAGAPPVEQVTIGGQPGYVIKAGEINPAAVRVGKAIIMATSVADAERTIAVSTGANLSTTPAGRVLDEHDAFVSQTVDVKDYANAIASMMDGMGDPELKTAVDAMRKALQNQKEPAVFQMAFRLDDGLELRLDGLDKIMPMVIGVLTEVAPTFMK